MIAVYLSGILRLIKEWRYRSDIHKLHGMSDRQLSDIGLSRSQIEDAVRGEPQAGFATKQSNPSLKRWIASDAP